MSHKPFYNPDPIPEIGPAGWYFRDDCGALHGPYSCKEEVEDHLREYLRLYLSEF